MTTDVTKKKTITASEPNIKTGKHGGTSVPSKGRKPVNIARDRRITGYTRVKSGELKRRTVVRAPDMSRPDAKVVNPQVSIGSVPAAVKREKAIPVATLRAEPTVRTITDTKKEVFPFSIVFLSLICSVLFMYMIFNYVQINEHTSAVSDLKTEIATLRVERDDLTAKLDKKNDLTYIEKIAREELGMVTIDEIIKKYINMDPGDIITSFGNNPDSSSTD